MSDFVSESDIILSDGYIIEQHFRSYLIQRRIFGFLYIPGEMSALGGDTIGVSRLAM
jgi:hypothetical protein